VQRFARPAGEHSAQPRDVPRFAAVVPVAQVRGEQFAGAFIHPDRGLGEVLEHQALVARHRQLDEPRWRVPGTDERRHVHGVAQFATPGERGGLESAEVIERQNRSDRAAHRRGVVEVRDLHLHQDRGIVVWVRDDELRQLVVGILETETGDPAGLVVPGDRVAGVFEGGDDGVDRAPHVPLAADEEVQVLGLPGDARGVVDQLLVHVERVAAAERDPVFAPGGGEASPRDIELPGSDRH
jgi:hypothetical protein